MSPTSSSRTRAALYTRRSTLAALGCAGALKISGLAGALAAQAPGTWRRYDRAIVIDGPGGPGGRRPGTGLIADAGQPRAYETFGTGVHARHHPPFAADLNSPRRFETLAALLSDRGHSDARIEKILGLDLLRVFMEAWRPA